MVFGEKARSPKVKIMPITFLLQHKWMHQELLCKLSLADGNPQNEDKPGEI